ncbi:MAG: hypothetical protein ACKVPX_13040 [Myxococcaceae bacterium]
MRALPWVLALAAASALAAEGEAPSKKDKPPQRQEVRAVAERYLRDVTGEGGDGKQLLLGGVGYDAELLTLENATLVGEEPARVEVRSLASALAHVEALDRAGQDFLAKLSASQGGDGLSVQQISRAEAERLMAPTRERAKRFGDDHPVLAYALRVDKDAYWHPRNPVRALLNKVGRSGTYALTLYLFKVQSKEGPTQRPRLWPLRVLRFRAGDLDTGWRVLPASGWEPL